MYNKKDILKRAVENQGKYHKHKTGEPINTGNLRIEIMREANISYEQAQQWIRDFEEQGYLKSIEIKKRGMTHVIQTKTGAKEIIEDYNEQAYIVCKDFEKPYEF